MLVVQATSGPLFLLAMRWCGTTAHNWETDVKEVILNGELFFYEKER